MDNPKEARIRDSQYWLKAARRNLGSFKKLTRHDYLPFIKKRPREPHDALNMLQQSVEKMVKAVALASGKFRYKELEKKYSHNSLKLCADIITELFKIPIAHQLADFMAGPISEKSEAKIVSYEEGLKILSDVRNKVNIKGQILSEWAYEFATLPEEIVGQLIYGLMKGHRSARIIEVAFSMIPIGMLSKKEESASRLGESFLKGLDKKGLFVSDRVRRFFQSEVIEKYFKGKSNEEKLKLLKYSGKLIMLGWLLQALWVLSALTFPHGTLPRYPEDESQNIKYKMGSESYDEGIGLASHILKAGKLTKIALNELDDLIELIVNTFLYYENSDSVLLEVSKE